MQQTLVLLKPDAVQRGLVGKLTSRLEDRGLKLVAMKLLRLDKDMAELHYNAHIGKPFFVGLVAFIISSPIVAIVVEGENAVEIVRTLMGTTDPVEADPGTVRGDLAASIGLNLIHGSDSLESASREIDLFFTTDEVFSYYRDVDRWITES